ncbi:hypothetical protein COB18_00735 [Candidatus Kaiserbacteria bacterium]|nr:MAG: hypothetical protein COB18_00735 [Candidatus Kaiserbacteria bacterium]
MTILYPLVSGLLGGLAIALPSVWFLSFIALGIFFYGLWFKINTGKKAFWSGAFFGFATTGASIWWLWDALPLAWTSINNSLLEWFVVLIIWTFVSTTISIAPALFALALWKIRKITFWLPILASFGWVVQEMVRGWLFYIATLGKQSLFGSHFSISDMGYTLAESHYLLQLAENVGIYGLSFTVALVASTLALVTYSLLHKKIYVQSLIFISITIFILSIPAWHTYTFTSDKTIRFSLIATYIPVPYKVSPEVIYKEKLEEIARSGISPDVIVLPEGNGLVKIYPDKKVLENELQKLFKDKEVLIISSSYTPDRTGEMHSLLYYYSTTRGIIATYEKMFLMAQGEYAPYVPTFLLRILNNKVVNDHFNSVGGTLVRGSGVVSVPYKDVTIGSLLCSEILSPSLYRDLVTKQNANILVNLSHTSWFGGSKTLFAKVQQMAKVHAVQNRTYFVQASNGFPSFVLSPTGEVVITTELEESTIITIDIPIQSK